VLRAGLALAGFVGGGDRHGVLLKASDLLAI